MTSLGPFFHLARTIPLLVWPWPFPKALLVKFTCGPGDGQCLMGLFFCLVRHPMSLGPKVGAIEVVGH